MIDKRVTRVLAEGTFSYHRRLSADEWLTETVPVFILDWFPGPGWTDATGGGSSTRAVVVLRKEAWFGELLDPTPAGSIREVEASGYDGTHLVVDLDAVVR